jgi:hypothetical protein
MRQNLSMEQLWHEQLHQNFPPSQAESAEAPGLPHIEKFQEPKVDKMRQNKEEQLERQKRDHERQKRNEKSKLLQGRVQ